MYPTYRAIVGACRSARQWRCHETLTYHKRMLPSCLIAMNSHEGRKIFKEALDLGGMESYFPLAEQFVTQSEPSYCSISSLAMVLNGRYYSHVAI
jgi:hypothetical protein